MRTPDDIVQIVIAASALGRIAATETRNETPAAQWRTLSILHRQGPQRLGELARLSRVTQPGMTRLATGMATEGLVRRAPDPEDSRATVIDVTAAGRDALFAWHRQVGEALTPLFSDLPEQDWAALRRASQILNDRIAAFQEDPR